LIIQDKDAARLAIDDLNAILQTTIENRDLTGARMTRADLALASLLAYETPLIFDQAVSNIEEVISESIREGDKVAPQGCASEAIIVAKHNQQCFRLIDDQPDAVTTGHRQKSPEQRHDTDQ
jgi:hypothetical protein